MSKREQDSAARAMWWLVGVALGLALAFIGGLVWIGYAFSGIRG